MDAIEVFVVFGSGFKSSCRVGSEAFLPGKKMGALYAIAAKGCNGILREIAETGFLPLIIWTHLVLALDIVPSFLQQRAGMDTPTDTLLSGWQTAGAVVIELIRANPAWLAVPLVVGVAVAVLVAILRSRLWIPTCINSDHRQGFGSFCIGLMGGDLQQRE